MLLIGLVEHLLENGPEVLVEVGLGRPGLGVVVRVQLQGSVLEALARAQHRAHQVGHVEGVQTVLVVQVQDKGVAGEPGQPHLAGGLAELLEQALLVVGVQVLEALLGVLERNAHGGHQLLQSLLAPVAPQFEEGEGAEGVRHAVEQGPALQHEQVQSGETTSARKRWS